MGVIIDLVMKFCKFLLPVYFSLKYLRKSDNKKIENILKFWCLNSLYMIVEFLIPFIVNEIFEVLLTLFLYFYLTYNNYEGSAKVFDAIILPIIENYRSILVEKVSIVYNLYY